MPKFSDNEKEMIKQKLRSVGERLFTAYGVKKVSVDELVQAAGIAKGSFYTFYENKEHLFMDISGSLQTKMWIEMEEFLQAHSSLPPRKLTKQLFIRMFDLLDRYPMLRLADGETAEYLYRKLPKEVIKTHTRDDKNELLKLQEYGIRFTCDIDLATKTLQKLALVFLDLKEEDPAVRDGIMDIMLNGVINEIVRDDK